MIENQPSLPTQGREAPRKISKSQDPFVDPGNAGAKDLAERRGISVGEATRELRLAHAAANAGAKLADEDSSVFGGVSVEGDRITVYVKRGAVPAAIADKARSTMDQDLRGAVQVIPVTYSRKELRARGEKLATDLGDIDSLVGYRMSVANGELTILSTNPSNTRAAARAKLGEIPEGVAIEASEPIELTSDAYGGTAANTGVSTGCPTFGFVVADITSSSYDRGLMTAGHASSASARYNGYSPAALSSCSGGSPTLGLKREWTYRQNTVNLGLDFAWYRNSNQYYNAYFWQGDRLGTVHSSIYPAAGIAVCKFGRVTGKTCGTTTGQEVWNANYGWMLQVRKDAQYSQMNAVGDSGGPVWNGSSAAVGIVHARQGTDYMLVAANYSLQENNLPIRVVIF